MFKERIVFMGTPEISKKYLQALIKSKFNVVAVYTQPPIAQGRGMKKLNQPVHDLALVNKIPVYHPNDFGSKNVINEFKKINSEIAIVMGYGLILPKSILTAPRKGCINVHISLLPKWRGAAPIEHAILHGDKTTGVTIFKLEEKLDTGPIISKNEIVIDPNINKGDLTSKLNIIGTELLIKTLQDLFINKISLTKQDNNNATYANKITPEMRKINFFQDTNKVYNQIRAFSPSPSAWFFFNKERIKIINCSMEICNSTPSLIMNDRFHIGCHNGKIIPQIVQREGKKPMEIEVFLRGFKFDLNKKVNA